MKITGFLEHVDIHQAMATVTILANGDSHYFFAEPRMLVRVFEECYPNADWRNQRVTCTVDGPLLISFKPADD
jgi:hypothetical protein